jgi:sugar (pentulose or hexulose) kinase
MGGAERDMYVDLLKKLDPPDDFMDFDEELYAAVVADADLFITPGVLPGTGPFPNSTSGIVAGATRTPVSAGMSPETLPEPMRNAKYAYAALNAALAVQTGEMLKNVGVADGVTIYIEGGFRKNEGYQAYLSALFPECGIVLSNIPEATAFGAALLGKAALEKRSLLELDEDFEIETSNVESRSFAGMEAYAEKFRELSRG